ncbi:MAG: hypothetical protein WBM02_02530 [bacterium]
MMKFSPLNHPSRESKRLNLKNNKPRHPALLSLFTVKNLIFIGILFILLIVFSMIAPSIPPKNLFPAGPPIRILFDDLHGQAFGNADWTIDTAYSDFADDLHSVFEASVFGSSQCRTSELTTTILQSMDCLIIPEPNNRFTKSEIDAVREFVAKGGSLFLIADHGGSDRNFSGWDSSLILNEITESWGVTFLGDTFTETPLRGVLRQITNFDWPDQTISRHAIMDNIQAVAAWSATSLIVEPEPNPWHVLLASETTGHPFFACGIVGTGRVAAIGDSSMFDDGTGNPGKNRHQAYHSWLFSQRRLAIQTVAWLLQKQPSFIPRTSYPYPLRTDKIKLNNRKSRVVLDISHGNNDSGIMNRFADDCIDTLSIPVVLNQIDYKGLKRKDILVIPNPDSPLSEEDIADISGWVHSGGRLMVIGASPRQPRSNLSNFNQLLTAIGSTIRLQPTQIFHDVNNTGNPWSLLISRFSTHPEFAPVTAAIFWSAVSLGDPADNPLQNSESVTVLAISDPDTRLDEYKPVQPNSSRYRFHRKTVRSDGCAVAAMEIIDKGAVLVLAANPFTNFQYMTESDINQKDVKPIDHQTPLFNRALITILKQRPLKKTKP